MTNKGELIQLKNKEQYIGVTVKAKKDYKRSEKHIAVSRNDMLRIETYNKETDTYVVKNMNNATDWIIVSNNALNYIVGLWQKLKIKRISNSITKEGASS